VLQHWARDLTEVVQEQSAVLLRETSEVLRRALRDFPDDEDLRKQMESLGTLCNEVGVAAANSESFETSIELLWLACEWLPESPRIGNNLCDVTARYATAAIADGRVRKALGSVHKALERFPNDTQLAISRSTLEELVENT
jgi:hypothetical protein